MKFQDIQPGIEVICKGGYREDGTPRQIERVWELGRRIGREKVLNIKFVGINSGFIYRPRQIHLAGGKTVVSKPIIKSLLNFGRKVLKRL